jgi:hypothetical protein
MDTSTRIKVFYKNPLGQLLHFDTTQIFDNLKDAEIYFSEFYGIECRCEFETTKEIVTC